MNTGDQDQKMTDVLSKTWTDETFRLKLLSNPAAVLKAEGVELPAGVEVRVVEDTDRLFHLVLPVKTTLEGELSDDDLANVSGGGRKVPTGKTQYSYDTFQL